MARVGEGGFQERAAAPFTGRGRRCAVVAAALLALSGGSARGTEATASVTLRWAPVADAATYEVEIAADAAFDRIVVHERTAAPGYRWRAIPADRHFWRVRGLDDRGRAGRWSEVRVIEAALRVPELLGPADGTRVVLDTGSRVLFSWRPSQVMKEYALEIAASPGFEGATEAWRGAGSSVRLPPPGLGRFHWRVRGISLAGQETAPSAPRSFLVEPGAPVPRAPEDGGRVPDGPVELAWDGPPAASRWRLVVRPPGGAEPSVMESTSRAATFLPPAAGEYAWEVRALSPDGSAGEASASRRFLVEARPPLPAPSPIVPAPGATLGGDEAPGPVSQSPPAPAQIAPPVEETAEGWGRLRAGVRVGWRSNLLRVSGLVIGAELSLRTPALARRLLLAVRGEFETASATVPPLPGIASATEAAARLVPVALLAVYEMPLAPWALYAGGGPALVVARFAVGPDAGLSAAVAAEAVLGAERRLGPGSAFLELGARLGRIDGTLGQIRTGGLGLAAGYRY